MRPPLDQALIGLRRTVDKEFQRNRRLHGRRMHCGSGCASCCWAPFSITELEAAAVSQACARLPAEVRRGLDERAGVYLEQRAAMFARNGYIESRGALPPPEFRLACPALVDGKCLIYAARPLLCRRYGAPLLYPALPGRVFACELNFARGERIEDPALPDAQHAFAAAAERLEAQYDEAGGRRANQPLTVAHAALESFEDYLDRPPAK